jgi:hypothetical protein
VIVFITAIVVLVIFTTLQIFTAMKIHVLMFWVVTPYKDAVGPPKHWYPSTSLHGIITQKTTTCIFAFSFAVLAAFLSDL